MISTTRVAATVVAFAAAGSMILGGSALADQKPAGKPGSHNDVTQTANGGEGGKGGDRCVGVQVSALNLGALWGDGGDSNFNQCNGGAGGAGGSNSSAQY
jgi:hypothetical protein